MDDFQYRQICNIATLQARQEGFFLSYAKTVEESQTGFLNKFTSVRSNEERFLLCWSLPATHGILSLQEAYKSKDPKAALEKRKEALEFVKKDPTMALGLLNQSIIRDDIDTQQSSETLQLRSNLLLKMNKPEFALLDAQASVKGTPESKKFSTYALVGDCFLALGPDNTNKRKAEVAYKIGENLASKLEGKAKRKAVEMIRNKLNTIDDRQAKEVPTALQQATLELTNGKSKKYNGAFKGFKVDCSPEMGRFAATAVDVQAGDTLVMETPYSSVLNVEKYGSYCHHCLDRLTVAFSCSWCRGVGFCSEKCRDASTTSYHLYECHVTDLLDASGMSAISRLALRIVSQNSLKYFKLPDNGTQSKCSYSNISKLDGHEELRDVNDLFCRTMMAVFLLKVLRFSGYFLKKHNTPVSCLDGKGVPDLTEDELLIGVILMKNLQFLQFNAHEVCDLALVGDKSISKAKSQTIGLAIYQTASYFNHSCYPNVTRYFVGNQLVIRSLRDIPAGSPLFDSYGLFFTQKSIRERKKISNGRYWFDCQCEACVSDWPTYQNLDEEDERFGCSKCGSVLPRLDKNQKENIKACPKCQEDNDIDGKVDAMKNAKKLLEDGVTKMDRQDNIAATESLIQAIKLMQSNVRPPFKNLHLAQDNLRLCFAALGSTWKTEVQK